MHMADALISPAVGGVMWAAAIGIEAYSIRGINRENQFENKKISVMGVAGAFVFAAQMINFSIPGTGSSGHLGGGLLLAALLGPQAGFLVLSVVLAIQALFFADGGLLALGCNIFNMGFFSCYIAYPLIMRPMLSKGMNRKNIFTASFFSACFGLLSGAFAVVAETSASNITELPFSAFAALMLPVHLAIGLVEGIATALVLIFIHHMEPALLDGQKSGGGAKKAVAALAIAALLCAGFFSWFSSANPDGLEWSVQNVAGTEPAAKDGFYEPFSAAQEHLSFLPDYNLKNAPESDSVVNPGGSLAGIAGSAMVLVAVSAAGCGIVLLKKRVARGHG